MNRPSVLDAVAQIAEIHGQIAKGEVYRGWRATPVALSGMVGLAAAWFQRPGLGADDPLSFVIYWSAVAVAAAAVGVSEIVYAGLRTSFERRQTRRVAIQFLPPIAVALLVTVAFIRLGAALVALLPGLWALCFGLAIFAARPYLARGSGVVASYLRRVRNVPPVGRAHDSRAIALGSRGRLWRGPAVRRRGDLLESRAAGLGGPPRFREGTMTRGRRPASGRQTQESGRFAYERLDRAIHEKARLGILTSLVTRPEGLLFGELKHLCDLTDGNLSRHLDVLRDAGLIEIWKGFEGRRPQTMCRLTTEGRRRFVQYWKNWSAS